MGLNLHQQSIKLGVKSLQQRSRGYWVFSLRPDAVMQKWELDSQVLDRKLQRHSNCSVASISAGWIRTIFFYNAVQLSSSLQWVDWRLQSTTRVQANIAEMFFTGTIEIKRYSPWAWDAILKVWFSWRFQPPLMIRFLNISRLGNMINRPCDKWGINHAYETENCDPFWYLAITVGRDVLYEQVTCEKVCSLQLTMVLASQPQATNSRRQN